MSTERKKLRKAIANALRRRKIAGGNVVEARSLATWNEDLPAISIYPLTENAEEYTESDRELKRTVKLLIEIKVKGKDQEDAADELDELCEEVEQVLGAEDAKNGIDCTVEKIMLNEAEFEFDAEGQSPVAAAKLVYDVVYLYLFPKLGADALDDLKGADVDWDIGTAKDPAPEAEDTLTTELGP